MGTSKKYLQGMVPHDPLVQLSSTGTQQASLRLDPLSSGDPAQSGTTGDGKGRLFGIDTLMVSIPTVKARFIKLTFAEASTAIDEVEVRAPLVPYQGTCPPQRSGFEKVARQYPWRRRKDPKSRFAPATTCDASQVLSIFLSLCRFRCYLRPS